VKEVELMVRATQMYGSEGVLTQWCLPARMPIPPAPAPRLSPAQSAPARLSVPLPSLPNEHPETDVFVLEAANGEWESQSTMIRQCATRHPRLIPARAWLGVVSPGAHMHTQLEVFNDTHQHICWWGTPFRWHGENEPSKLCSGREPCTECKERACTCALLRPTRGALAHLKGTQMVYDVNAPDNDGCVATLLQVRRTLGDVARVPSGAGCEARASLVAYRVLAPRLVVRALPCHGDKVPGECEGCSLDTGEQKCKGTAVLRPSAALALGRCTCYRLRITNITPLPTTVKWEGPMGKEEFPWEEPDRRRTAEEMFEAEDKKKEVQAVRSRTVIIRNESVLTARWTSAVRNWPRKRCRTLTTDAWAVDVRDPGLAIEISPACGVLGARASLALTVSVYADCWGLYRDQILIKIEKLEPIVADVWVEAVGPPLQLMRAPSDGGTDLAPTLWMSSSDPDRVIRVKNVSRSEVAVHAYVLKEHAHFQDVMPFRLYLRFFDVLPRFCPCVTAFDSDHCLEEQSDDSSSKVPEDMDTGVEVFFTKDFGLQEDTFFKVEPAVFSIEPGAFTELQVTLTPPEHGELAPDAAILLRTLPFPKFAGPGWYRNEPPPQLVHLRQTEREGVLRASDKQLRVKFCALDLPSGDVMRIRKSFRIQNIGNGPLHIAAGTKGLWTIIQDEGQQSGSTCAIGCGCAPIEGNRVEKVPLYLPPRSSTEMTVEVCIHTADAWPADNEGTPCSPPNYEQWKRSVTPLSFYDDDNVLLTIPLILELEFPLLYVEPSCINFGFVTDGDTRKSFFTVAHSSRTATLDLVTEWDGNNEFRLWPRNLHLPPGTSERVYVQYTARWRVGPVEGCARVVYTPGGAGAWCRASLSCRASPARDHKCHASVHDHTDDPKLLPPDLTFL
ncbi:hypothetical protein ABMA27_016895, partial [Loxostege sticticalis]